MWASGDYPAMVETFLLPLGPRLVEACGIGAGDAGARRRRRHRQRLDPRRAARRATSRRATSRPSCSRPAGGAPRREGVELEWVEADAEHLPFEDASFDVVMSSIGAMFAPHHQEVADELVRVCRPGGTIGLLSWTPEGMIGALFRTMGPFAPAPPPGAQPPPLWGSEEHVRGLFGDRVDFRDAASATMLEITAFERPHDYGEHFKDALRARRSPRRANAARNDREAELDEALDAFCDEWNRGTPERARFEQEYLLAGRHTRLTPRRGDSDPPPARSRRERAGGGS